MIETLVELGIRCADRCNISPLRIMLHRRERRSVCLEGRLKRKASGAQTILKDGEPWNANMILDDSGDLAAMVHEKYPEMLENVTASPRKPPACIVCWKWWKKAH